MCIIITIIIIISSSIMIISKAQANHRSLEDGLMIKIRGLEDVGD